MLGIRANYIVYPIATGTALSRLNRPRHWASDIFAGAAIGYFVGKVVTRYNPFLERAGIEVRPVIVGETMGLSVVLRM